VFEVSEALVVGGVVCVDPVAGDWVGPPDGAVSGWYGVGFWLVAAEPLAEPLAECVKAMKRVAPAAAPAPAIHWPRWPSLLSGAVAGCPDWADTAAKGAAVRAAQANKVAIRILHRMN
jgi:hypothetical protein